MDCQFDWLHFTIIITEKWKWTAQNLFLTIRSTHVYLLYAPNWIESHITKQPNTFVRTAKCPAEYESP